MIDPKELAKQKAMIVRAREIAGEVADLNPGDAAIMLCLSAALCQKKYLTDMARETLMAPENGHPFRAIVSLFRNSGKEREFEESVEGFLLSNSFQQTLFTGLSKSLPEIASKTVIAVALLDIIEEKKS